MEKFINRYATPLTTGLFAVSTISGVALFFHWAPGMFRAMHEWLSMVLLLPFILHVWKNWRPLVAYFQRGILVLPVAACLLIAAPFALGSLLVGSGGGNPAIRAVALMTRAPVSDLAPLLKTEPDAVLAKLTQMGFAATSVEQTLDAIARASGKQPREVLFALMRGQ